ncbi:hypothetical protein UlMin_030984 [Ulmus minor]
MAFWGRIGKSKLKQLSHQFKTIPYGSLINPTVSHSKACVTENQFLSIPNNPSGFCYNVRFFAAPVQFQKTKEEKDSNGPRINEKITAEFVRLVIDKEHTIVSRREALERAKKLNLDLVEVQGSAKPPVCKFMDFHKEKYLKQLTKKDRAKSKPEVTLRAGSPKEVRFSGKTEQKDLQMKADTVRRLMEEGYRVKCHAKGTADQAVLGILSRLSTLIEEESIVESGPTLGKDGAYVIVRHVKFGPSKKGGGKKTKAVGDASSGGQEAIEDLNHAESSLETEDGSFSYEVDQSRSSSLAASNSQQVVDSSTENRYRKNATRNQYPPRDSVKLDPRFSNQGKQSPRDMNFSRRINERDEAQTNGFRNSQSPLNNAPRREPFVPGLSSTPRPPPRREPFPPGLSSTPRPSFGVFNASQGNAQGRNGVAPEVGANREENRYAARSPGTRGVNPNQNFRISKQS